MRLDGFLFRHPAQHLASAVSGIANQSLQLETEALLDTLDQGFDRVHFLDPVRSGGHHVDDCADLDNDQIVGRIGIERRTSRNCCPLRTWIRQGKILRDFGLWVGFIKGIPILADGTVDRGVRPVCLGARYSTLPIGIGLDHTGVDGETFTPQPGVR